MFCYKCGTQIRDNSIFCSNCGTRINNVSPNTSSITSKLTVKKNSFGTNTIFSIVISVLMILAMSLLPMFELKLDASPHHVSYTAKLLEYNYLGGHMVREEINAFSKIAFIFMLTAILALVIFSIMKKSWFNLIASIINLGMLLIYDIYIISTWESWGSAYDHYAANMSIGNVICTICAIILVVLSFLDFKTNKKTKATQ